MWTLCSVLMHQLRTFRSESSDDSYLSILSGLFPPSELCTVTNSHVWTVYFQVKQSIQQLPVYIILPLPLSELCTVTNSHVWTVYFQVREFTWQLLIHIILPLPVSELCIVTNSHVWTVYFQVREFNWRLSVHLVLQWQILMCELSAFRSESSPDSYLSTLSCPSPNVKCMRCCVLSVSGFLTPTATKWLFNKVR